MKKKRSEQELGRLLADFTGNLTGEAGGAAELSCEDMAYLSVKEVSSLFETVQTVFSVIQPRELPDGFEARISQAVQDRFQEQISAEKIQRIIGMAVTMEDFRKGLFQDIVATCRGIGINLTPKEIAALRNLKEGVVKEFANSLDERITKFFPTNLP